MAGSRFLEDMECLGRLRSSEEIRLLNVDRRELTSGSISSESSPTSQDQVRSIGGKEFLKRQHQSTLDHQGDGDYEYQIDDPSHAAEKKRRLTIEQVNFLEMSFETDMRLEPERKALLAKQLGVFPRQVAIWFQNRRARWKNKQLEQEFEILKAHYSAVVNENESLLKENNAVVEENKKLMAEVARLIISLQRVDNSSNLGFSQTLDGSQVGGSRSQTFQALDSGYEVQEQQHQLEGEDGYLSSGKSELTFPTKSFDDQSEVQDSGQSYRATVGMVGPSETGMDNSKVCPMSLLDDSEDLFENMFNQFLIQQFAVGGLCIEDARTFYLGGEDEWAGFS